jgi:hypothetical protein
MSGIVRSTLVGLLSQDRADEADDRGVVEEDADDVGVVTVSLRSRSW